MAVLTVMHFYRAGLFLCSSTGQIKMCKRRDGICKRERAYIDDKLRKQKTVAYSIVLACGDFVSFSKPPEIPTLKLKFNDIEPEA